MKPRILLTFDFDDKLGYILKSEYAESLKRAGAEVDSCFYDKDIVSKKIRKCDGVLIPGGLCDLSPESYGQTKLHARTKLNSTREDFDLFLANLIVEENKPCLAICWGFQLFNVFLGGELYQHLPEEFPSDILHEQKEDARIATHKVLFERNSYCHKTFGLKEMAVNSTHHQGIKTLAAELSIEAKAEDGLIEAYRHTELDYLIGLEWHPERLAGDPFIPDFVNSCRRN